MLRLPFVICRRAFEPLGQHYEKAIAPRAAGRQRARDATAQSSAFLEFVHTCMHGGDGLRERSRPPRSVPSYRGVDRADKSVIIRRRLPSASGRRGFREQVWLIPPAELHSPAGQTGLGDQLRQVALGAGSHMADDFGSA